MGAPQSQTVGTRTRTGRLKGNDRALVQKAQITWNLRNYVSSAVGVGFWRGRRLRREIDRGHLNTRVLRYRLPGTRNPFGVAGRSDFCSCIGKSVRPLGCSGSDLRMESEEIFTKRNHNTRQHAFTQAKTRCW